MFPFNPREKQNLAWAWHLFKKFQWFPLGPSQLKNNCDFKPPWILISLAKALEKMTRGDHPWCRSIKYWEVNSIVHSLLIPISIHYEIDEYFLGFNFCILDLDWSMASSTFKHYRLHQGSNSLSSLLTFHWYFWSNFSRQNLIYHEYVDWTWILGLNFWHRIWRPRALDFGSPTF
jgi:hypothetical protein